MRAVRAQFKRHPLVALAYKVTVGVVGAVVLVIGVIAIPYPGPGWLIVFTGLGILATEFAWARRILHEALERYRVIMAWYKRQHGVVRVAGAVGTFVITVVTLWFVGAIGLMAGWFGFDQPWLGGLLP
ncbi:TIGR02611 family protein [Hoyosella sp. G463]|uniref:TIGR02611 family protein n=2 Tax=Lolliginicoccus lacisalsi TaxID=2742202 RepID=A0A927JAI3_9ACTN|nr:TIGR02611 family protein [Lolliginicoccus lacisalsi]